MKLSWSSFPMLFVPVVLYNIVAAATVIAPDLFGSANEAVTRAIVTIPMIAPGAHLALSLGDLILFVGFVGLFIELISSTGSSDQALMGDALTFIVLIVCLVEFLLLPPFATGTFLLLLIMVMMDTAAGFIVSTVSARQDIDLGA